MTSEKNFIEKFFIIFYSNEVSVPNDILYGYYNVPKAISSMLLRSLEF